MESNQIHEGGEVLRRGEPIERARAAMIMVHGRGASAASILSLVDAIERPGFAFLAPQASGNAWYPNPFLRPRIENEPWLGSALATLERLDASITASGIAPDRVMLLGFSQGGCLALEYAARHPRRFGGIVGLSGGLIGADGELAGYAGSLGASAVFLGCSDRDPHIPKERVSFTARTLESLGARVEQRLYPGLGHTIIEDEIDVVRRMMQALGDQAQ